MSRSDWRARGEAAAHIPRDLRARFPQIPWAKMQAIRNVVVHEYFRVDLEILWKTLKQDLTSLVPALREAIDQSPPDGS